MTAIEDITGDRILQTTVVITVISLFFARPRIRDINFHTLYSILAILTITQVFSCLHVLDVLAYRLATSARSTRRLTTIFTILSIISAMFLTNDITVLTPTPLYLTIIRRHRLPEILPVTLIGMGTSIGTAFTPRGNSRNVFAASRYNVSPIKFFSWSIPLLLVSLIIVLVFIFFIKDKPIPTVPLEDIRINIRPTLLTIAVSIFLFFGTFNIVPAYVPAIVAMILALIVNPSTMLRVDYALLLTFTCLSIFISDIQQIPLIATLISKTIFSEHSILLTSVISSQFTSDVPSAILIGKFTNFAEVLFLGSNIGGFSPMVNMLVFKSFVENGTVSKRKSFWIFSVLEFAGLIILTILGWVVLNFVI